MEVGEYLIRLEREEREYPFTNIWVKSRCGYTEVGTA